MTFVDSVKTCLNKYADFSGRATRSEFWWFVLFGLIVTVVLSWFSQWLSGLAGLALLVPDLAVGARRLHDYRKSGWFQALLLVPVIGWAILLYWAVQPSDGPNQYGHPEVTPDSPTVMY